MKISDNIIEQVETCEISINHVDKSFGSGESIVIALKEINLHISHGEFVCLLGPSGCGKSTLLNAIAGFSLPTQGEIIVKGHVVTEPGTDRGMVFQEYALFPWMNVEKNIAFGMDIKGESKEKCQSVVEDLLNTLGLSEFRTRYPKDLSGGMRQRVAIARILALDPPIMLMDEPFGALDALTRRSLQDELLRIWEKSRKTIIFVTHSVEEAIYLGTRVVVLTYRPGTLKQDITLEIPRPRDTSGAEFNRIKRELGALVMEEQQRFSAAERKGG
ncbi:ABC transporter family protein [Yersinia pseudotuberculosis IP 32953]|uniref:ABC transporter ATP-binding protein n=3 Tax=Yersinia pseudotuberculosis TaxID=633 RepID=A0ABM7AK47_YERPU|nr:MULTISPECIES: ABC transporter ATP-binding protein [Yersinia pseudotuberculosis complex]ABS46936.1 ABC Transporter, ATP-binding protein [Yersinia pseudotuberculosis IP 31758]AJJ57204.1 ABC transporter family protein [Yersinia pseudotuberculosis IP 32953]AJK17067.1 ABC transporter family protein [Yersinia pseudotuberculosis str. PA3606]AYW93077.1 ABC transporter ATP-binding protein [Yersinia pseudotuberculosis]AYW97237.1 ABC transporter ATP-binding protein [Yersinia pseudotuberculosis]